MADSTVSPNPPHLFSILVYSLIIARVLATPASIAASTNAAQSQSRAANIEADLAKQGKLPHLSEVQNDNEPKQRQPGEEDAAGNSIHHKSTLGKILHWEHDGMNKDD